MTTLSVKGWGRAKRTAQATDHSAQITDFEEYTRIEVACDNSVAHQVVTMIESTAHTGLRGDGALPSRRERRKMTQTRDEAVGTAQPTSRLALEPRHVAI